MIRCYPLCDSSHNRQRGLATDARLTLSNVRRVVRHMYGSPNGAGRSRQIPAKLKTPVSVGQSPSIIAQVLPSDLSPHGTLLQDMIRLDTIMSFYPVSWTVIWALELVLARPHPLSIHHTLVPVRLVHPSDEEAVEVTSACVRSHQHEEESEHLYIGTGTSGLNVKNLARVPTTPKRGHASNVTRGEAT